jgi:membrane protease YdiL (CAAX protease family)
VVVIITEPLVPRELPWSALPTLLGALLAGWGLLSLEGRPAASLGFRLDRGAVRGVVVGLGLGVLLGLLAVVLIAAAGAVRWSAEGGDLGEWLLAGMATLWMLALPAAAEEAMLRGYPLQALAEVWGAGWALVVTSIVFALLHLPNPSVDWVGLVNIAGAGLFLGALFLRTRSLWWASGAHLGWNWSHAFLADLSVSGLELVDAPLVEPVLSGPAWLSGGGFGPEGSLLATVVVFAAAAWTWRGGHRLVSEES